MVENASCINLVALPKTDSGSPRQAQFAIATHSQGFIAFLPYKMLRLTALKPQHVPLEAKTLGEHLRKRRHKGKWQQKEVALRLGVSQWTLIGWETDQTIPSVRMMPRMLDFLGHDPFPEPVTFGERIVAKRRSLGLPRKHLAKMIGVDEGTLRSWETGHWKPTQRTREKLDAFMLDDQGLVWGSVHSRLAVEKLQQ